MMRRALSRVCVMAFAIAGIVASTSAGAQGTSGADAVPLWAFPTTSADLPGAKPPFDTVVLHRVPHSARVFTMAQAKDYFAPPDWFPASHARMPESVAHGKPGKVWACGFCHLLDGQGRAENATLAGLPESYIVSQVLAMRARTRQSGVAGWAPSARMTNAADSIADGDLAEAARYFSRMRAKPRYRVVEQAEVPATYEAGGLYSVRSGGTPEALGHRIIEVTEDLERHELRDPTTTFLAYVPPGSIAAGRRIATKVTTKGVAACAKCHGPDLRGIGVVPPLAGRSPTYLFRQLYGFKSGHRAGVASVPMQAPASALDIDDMIAVAAYAGSLRPNR